MILSSVLSVGAFSLAAQAFLVVPEINSHPEIEDKAPTTLDTTSQTIILDCASCPFALNSLRNGAHEWTSNVESDLEMKIVSADNSLKFNNVPFFPLQNPTLPPTLFVSQKKKDGEASTMEGLEGNLRLSYSLEFNEKKFEDNSLVTVLMTIMGLDGQMVKIDNLEIQAIKEADGKVSTPISVPIQGPSLRIPAHPPLREHRPGIPRLTRRQMRRHLVPRFYQAYHRHEQG